MRSIRTSSPHSFVRLMGRSLSKSLKTGDMAEDALMKDILIHERDGKNLESEATSQSLGPGGMSGQGP